MREPTDDYLPERVPFSDWHPEVNRSQPLAERVRKLRWERGAALIGLPLAFIAISIGVGELTRGHAVFIGVFTTYFIAAWSRAWYGRAHASIRDLMDLPPAVPQYPVEIDLLSGGVKYGSDRGIITIVDGSFHFEGRRTQFSLPRSRVVEKLIKNSAFDRMKSVRYNLKWEADGASGEIRITPFDRIAGAGERYAAKFYREFYGWYDDRVPFGKELLPPVRPHPAQLRAVQIKLWALTASLFGGGVLFAVCLAEASFAGYGFVILGAVAITFLLRYLQKAREEAKALNRMIDLHSNGDSL